MSARAKNLLIGGICFLAGALAVQTLTNLHAQPTTPPAGTPAMESKKPTWINGMNLGARTVHEGKFSEGTRKYGVEVFRDENHGNLIYISETGSIAVVPQKPAK